MNYYEIDQRIPKYKMPSHLSQEQLAEKVGISIIHMSHTKTGNTKLSLLVLVNIANALSVQIGAIIYEKPRINKTVIKREVSLSP